MPAALSHSHLLHLPLLFLSFLLYSQTLGFPRAAESFRRALFVHKIHAAPLPTSTASAGFRRILQTTFSFPPPFGVYSLPPRFPYPAPSWTGYSPTPAKGKTVNIGLVVGISSAGVVVIMIFITLLVWCRKKTGKPSHPAELAVEGNSVPVISTEATEMDSVSVIPQINPRLDASAPPVGAVLDEATKVAQEFTYAQLADATENFSCKLGKGGSGSVYKGALVLQSSLDAANGEQKSLVAVKRLSHGSKQGFREFMSEVTILTRLRHRNLVKLHGWCQHSEELFLVYEYMSEGSLDMHLFGNDVSCKAPLQWNVRYKIVKGLVSALYYLHEQCDICVLHRDIKSSNVLLDADFNAKLGDSGLARLMEHDQTFNSTLPAGTLGYLAPECLTMGRPHKESDVFSFGVVVLEIVCGRKPFLEPREVKKKERVHLVDWVRKLYDHGKVLDAVDPRLQESYSFSERENREIEQLISVGLWCADPNWAKRPSMKMVIGLLNLGEELALPMDHPHNMPEAMHKPGPDKGCIDEEEEQRSQGHE